MHPDPTRPTELPLVPLDEVIEHATSQRGVLVGPVAWWQAVHTALGAPHALTDADRQLLPGAVDRALRSGDAEAITRAWSEAPLLCDRMWTVAVHCPADRSLVAHLVLAAAAGSPRPVAETLCRDLIRMSAIDVPRWGGPVAAARRLDQAVALADRVGIEIAPVRDLYDLALDSTPTLTLTAVCRRGVRHGAAALTGVMNTLAVGEVLIVDAEGLHDRLAVQVMGRIDSLTVDGLELVSGARCLLHPDADRWAMTTRLADDPRSAGRGAQVEG